eukprot:614447-Ditylum_brightwellii.AAC.1
MGLGAEDRMQQWNKESKRNSTIAARIDTDFFREFTSRKRLEECHHGFDTQLNEGLNTVVAMVWGEKTFWSAVFEKLDMDMSDGLTNFLEQKDTTHAWRQGYK